MVSLSTWHSNLCHQKIRLWWGFLSKLFKFILFFSICILFVKLNKHCFVFANDLPPRKIKQEKKINFFIVQTIVNRGDWLGSPANIKVTNKDVKIYVGRSTTLHNLLFSLHTLCMSYVINTFLLVSSSVRSKQLLCFVQGQG